MAEITPSAVYDAVPNFNLMVKVVTATVTENTNTIDMGDYGFTSLYMSMATLAGAAVTSTVSGATLSLTGSNGATTILVIGV